MPTEVRAVSLLVDDGARATWDAMSPAEQDALVAWVNEPRSAGARRQRAEEATRALQAGGARTGLTRPSLVDTILDFLSPW